MTAHPPVCPFPQNLRVHAACLQISCAGIPCLPVSCATLSGRVPLFRKPSFVHGFSVCRFFLPLPFFFRIRLFPRLRYERQAGPAFPCPSPSCELHPRIREPRVREPRVREPYDPQPPFRFPVLQIPFSPVPFSPVPFSAVFFVHRPCAVSLSVSGSAIRTSSRRRPVRQTFL